MNAGNLRPLGSAAGALGLALASLLVGCAASGPRVSPDTTDAALWNDSALLQWVAGLAEDDGRFDELATVRSFEQLQATIEEVKQLVLQDSKNEQEAIEGLRMILKHLAVSTNDTLNLDYRNPLFAKRDPRNRDIGAYNPDAEYDQAFIDGRFDYKLTGDLGTVPYVSITVNGRAEGMLSQLVSFVDDTEIRKHATPDGRYVLWLTKSKPDGARRLGPASG